MRRKSRGKLDFYQIPHVHEQNKVIPIERTKTNQVIRFLSKIHPCFKANLITVLLMMICFIYFLQWFIYDMTHYDSMNTYDRGNRVLQRTSQTILSLNKERYLHSHVLYSQRSEEAMEQHEKTDHLLNRLSGLSGEAVVEFKKKMDSNLLGMLHDSRQTFTGGWIKRMSEYSRGDRVYQERDNRHQLQSDGMDYLRGYLLNNYSESGDNVYSKLIDECMLILSSLRSTKEMLEVLHMLRFINNYMLEMYLANVALIYDEFITDNHRMLLLIQKEQTENQRIESPNMVSSLRLQTKEIIETKQNANLSMHIDYLGLTFSEHVLESFSILQSDIDHLIRQSKDIRVFYALTNGLRLPLLLLFTCIFLLCFTVWTTCCSFTFLSSYKQKQIDREKIFYKFVPQMLIQLTGSVDIEGLALGNVQMRDISIFFADIRNFTALSESMTAKSVFSFLNTYLKTVGPVARKWNGVIDKFIGDGILIIFTSASDSVRSALEIQRELDDLRKCRRFDPDFPKDVRVGSGIHSGMTAVGILGEEFENNLGKMATTILGDAANIASDVEGLTSKYGSKILVTRTTLERVQDRSFFHFRYIGSIPDESKSARSRSYHQLYELLDEDLDKEKITSIPLFKEAMNSMGKNEFVRAKKFFKKALVVCQKDTTVLVRIAQCDDFIQSGAKLKNIEDLKT